jgi:succinylglutamate desuccinylase
MKIPSVIKNGYVIKKGKEEGPTSLIIAGNHGNEPCGIKAFEKLLPKLTIESGTVFFLLGNPEAIKQDKRFTEANLNRMFRPASTYTAKIKKTYEYKRAQFIKMIMKQVDVCLDIHSTTNKSIPFIICEKNAKSIVQYFPKSFTKTVSGFGDIEPGATDDYMDFQGKIGIGIECGQHQDLKAGKIAEEAIIAFLETRGHIKTKKEKKVIERKKLHMYDLYYSKTDTFKLTKQLDDFYEAKKGEVIAHDGGKPVKMKKDCIVVFAHDRNKKGEEAFLLGRWVKK